jgi:glycosyltransferase involved in cell wall biosynthesis
MVRKGFFDLVKLSVVIPTRNRPEKLTKCLSALEAARTFLDFECCVCDSSQDADVKEKVEAVVRQFSFAKYFSHQGKNAAAARNFCVISATGDILVTVDDDVYVEPKSISLLYEYYIGLENPYAIVCGSVKFGNSFSAPVVMRRIGYGRSALNGEAFDFVVSAFLLYPRSVATLCPWNERIKSSEDRMMGAIWRNAGFKTYFLPSATAIHDQQLNHYDVAHQRSHIYANLFDAIFTRKSFYWFLCFEFLGFAAGAKTYFRRREEAFRYIKAWYLGHKDFIRDWNYLKVLAKAKMQ